MKTQGPPRSSKGKGKAEESAPGKSPMARFRDLAKRLADVDPKKVRDEEAREKTLRAAGRKKRD